MPLIFAIKTMGSALRRLLRSLEFYLPQKKTFDIGVYAKTGDLSGRTDHLQYMVYLIS